MITAEQARIVPARVAGDLTVQDLRDALAAGWRDFIAQPAFGLFFAGIYVVAGWALYYLLLVRGEVLWLAPAAAGFPLLGPFTAVGLYEVSRRREAGLPMDWRATLCAMRGHGDDQPLLMGGLLFVAFSFWIGLAHGVFAIFMGVSGVGSESLAMFQTTQGILMLLAGGAMGAMVALLLYATTVVSLPLLVDRELDFLTAIIVSLSAIRANPQVLLAWAGMIAVAIFVAMVPAFLGLLIVLPVLGHATWHLYRRAVLPPGA